MTYHRYLWIFLIGNIVGVLIVATVTAAPLLPSGFESPLTILYPELNQVSAPSWLEEGIRASYTSNVALYTKYEDQFGNSVDGESAKVGNGITQIDLVGLSDGIAATTNTIYTEMPPYNNYKLLMSNGGISPDGYGPFWCNPEILATIPDTSTNFLVIQHLPYTIDGEQYATIRFDCLYGDQKNALAMVYDLESGLLLYHTINTGTEQIQKGYVDTTVTSGNSGYYQLKNLRKVIIPWANGSIPSFIRSGSMQQFAGQKEITVQGAVGAPMAFGRQNILTFGEVSNRFVICQLDVINQDVTTSTDTINTVSGISQLAGLFIPPEAAGLGTGTVDTDPDTGVQVSITRNDATGIVLTKTNNADQQSSYWYDPSGKLLQTMTESVTSTTGGFTSSERTVMQTV
ncbi:MAG: hypothetical protein V1862_06225 [Methanobacteriota archaeon]